MIVLIFILGLILGSFYNVVGLRLPVGGSLVKPGSHCPKCKKELKWYELIPVLSYIIQRGKCRKCEEKISLTYPIIELLTGILFAVFYYLFGFSYNFFTGTIIISVMMIVFVSDFKYKIILDSPLVIGSILVIILKFYYFGFDTGLKSLIAAVGMFMFLFLVKVFGDKVFKKESMGGGDVKLCFFTGLVLGLYQGVLSIGISSFIALPYAMITLSLKKEPEIPFGPFLMLGLLAVFIFLDPINGFIDMILP